MKSEFKVICATVSFMTATAIATLAGAETFRIVTSDGQIEKTLEVKRSTSTGTASVATQRSLSAKVSARTSSLTEAVPDQRQLKKVADTQQIAAVAKPATNATAKPKQSTLGQGLPAPIARQKTVDSIAAALERGSRVQFNILFDFDKATLKSPESSAIKALADTLKAHPNLVVEVQGHTDNKGDAAYNLALSQRRATAVVDRLINEYFIAPSRLRARGYGEAVPTATNATPQGQQLNRRVEVVKLGS
jgi:outer membrane protein OmpA-like peptidoglycan-associated protein